MNNPKLWEPPQERIEQSHMYAFMREMGQKYGFAAEWETLRRWSIEHREQFWVELLSFAGIEPFQRAETTCQGEGMLGTRWFPGMRLNYAAHLLRLNDDQPAILFESELGQTASFSRRELRAEVARCAAALKRDGVTTGDRVAGFVPNVPEAIIAMLATASLGAIWSSCSPDFGLQGVLDRFGQIEPTVLMVADGYTYGGKLIYVLDRVAEVAACLPNLKRVVVIPFLGANGMQETSYIEDYYDSIWGALSGDGKRQVCGWREYLDHQKYVAISMVHRKLSPSPLLEFVQVPFDHPLFIMYSSGTTGIPKCIVHGHGGTLLQHMKELMLHCDLRREDTIFYFTTCGWMMWNWVVSSLGVGATLVLYEGSPSYPDIHHLWKMAERVGVSVFGTSPKFISACMQAGIVPGQEHDLSKLRCILSTGSPLSVENFRWVYQSVKQDLQLSSISGGTDIISCFMLGNPMLPVHAGEIQCRGLGMDVHAFDEDSQPLIGRKGELVCTSPFPSQPVEFWNDADGSKYHKAYFDFYPGVWRHGDFVEITERGGVIVFGRSDATLNPGGVRIGTAEIYRLIELIPEVVDSIVVGKNVADDVEVCLFVVLVDQLTLNQELEDRIRRVIAEGASKRHIPKHIRQVSAVPYTISGKKVELAVSNIIHGQEVRNRDALANPEVIEQYRLLV